MRVESPLPSPPLEILERKFFEAKRAPVLKAAPEKSPGALALLLALGLILAGHALLTWRVPIIGDEAYYWLWSKHLALGYHDHPPLIGWLIAAATGFFGGSNFIRLPAVACYVVSAALFYSFSRNMLGSAAKARFALLLFLYIPILAISSVAAYTDTPLITSWVLCLWAGWKSLRDGRYWLLTGAGVGLAVLSKLVGLFLIPSFMLFFALNKEARSWFRTKIFWAGVLTAFCVSLPVIIWNFQHGFENFVFQAHDHLTAHPVHPLLSFGAYLGIQALSVSPLLFAVMIAAVFHLIKKSREGDTASQFLLSFALPIHLVFGILTLVAHVGFHWAVPGYIALVAACLNLPNMRGWLAPSLAIAMVMNLLLFFGFAYPEAIARMTLAAAGNNRSKTALVSFFEGRGYGELLGYKKLSDAVADYLGKMKNKDSVFLLTDSYTLSSDLTYYTGRPAHTFLPTGQGGEYARWDDFNQLRGQSALWVSFTPLSENLNEAEILRNAFLRVGPSETVEIRDGPLTRSFTLVRLFGLRRPEKLRSNFADVRDTSSESPTK